ncbi:MAG: hypothetical protein A2840_02065 [Candidatus Buchananbacteria bacterium RIFCSPHIGHO2_01_FULL_47_11b]|uniref:DUF2268 domain-containing protein n=1 Tax=Candidatus Buchananbacteria bacterium RIFCSPHIGHO2_01_FULL_47_11b TaxID=1797537 RepID=A0A1G1Y8Y9_9BACT|nr:MAG: hypothetical protein A2840_02065 [Candidatus Buchananbacteria bacterium RIFCSPHIGHO2_01_FULL_47_11b]HLC69856.1 hypothetical protein [Patescibacteria group bacterium]
MKLQFLYSKTKEKEKLLNIYEEYQWFVENDFPIVTPNFYDKIYRRNKGNRKFFIGELNTELDKIYNENDYQLKTEKVKDNWKKIEQDFFNIIKSFNLRIKNKYICYISLYGPFGQFKYPKVVDLRVHNTKDMKEANQTIAHELIHLLIYNKVKKLKLNYKQIEGVVDLFFTKTKLKTIFPRYKFQSIAIHDKELFRKMNE